jgi:hypothetical protein
MYISQEVIMGHNQQHGTVRQDMTNKVPRTIPNMCTGKMSKYNVNLFNEPMDDIIPNTD